WVRTSVRVSLHYLQLPQYLVSLLCLLFRLR
ncbi:na+/Pi-cotransporter family protein, partial [Vibrio parahaemolyticus V-223/04]